METSTINIEQTIEKPTGTKVIVDNTTEDNLKRFIQQKGKVIGWIQKKKNSNKKRKVLFNQGAENEETAYFFDDELVKVEE